MLSSMHILSLKQGKLYGERIPIEALPQGLRCHVAFFACLR